MFAKIGFVLIVILFGALMFAAGALAPETWRNAITATLGKVESRLATTTTVPVLPTTGAPKTNDASSPAGSGSATSPPGKSSATDAKPAAAAEAASPPIASQDLLVPPIPPDKATYALQAGRFVQADEANVLADRLKAAGLQVTVLSLVDAAKQTWSAVAIGQYPTTSDATAAGAAISKRLGLPGSMPVIMNPPPKAKT